MYEVVKNMIKIRRPWRVRYASDLLTGKRARIRAKRDLRRGIEPQPRYSTGKFWTD